MNTTVTSTVNNSASKISTTINSDETLHGAPSSTTRSFAQQVFAKSRSIVHLAAALSILPSEGIAVAQQLVGGEDTANNPSQVQSKRATRATPETYGVADIVIADSKPTDVSQDTRRTILVHRSLSDPGVYIHDPIFSIRLNPNSNSSVGKEVMHEKLLMNGTTALHFIADFSSPAVTAEAKRQAIARDGAYLASRKIAPEAVQVDHFKITHAYIQAINRYDPSEIYGTAETQNLLGANSAGFSFFMSPEEKAKFADAMKNKEVVFVWHYTGLASTTDRAMVNSVDSQTVKETAGAGLSAEQRSGKNGLTQIEAESFVRSVQQQLTRQITLIGQVPLPLVTELMKSEASLDRFFIAEQKVDWSSLTPQQQVAIAEHIRPLIKTKTSSSTKENLENDTKVDKKTTKFGASGGGGVNLGIVKFGAEAGGEITQQDIDTIEKKTGLTLKKDASSQDYVPTTISIRKFDNARIEAVVRQLSEVVFARSNKDYQISTPLSTDFTDRFVAGWAHTMQLQEDQNNRFKKLEERQADLDKANTRIQTELEKTRRENDTLSLRNAVLFEYQGESRKGRDGKTVKSAAELLNQLPPSVSKTIVVDGTSYQVERVAAYVDVTPKKSSYLFDLNVKQGEKLLFHVEGASNEADRRNLTVDLRQVTKKKKSTDCESELRHGRMWTVDSDYRKAGDKFFFTPRLIPSKCFVAVYVVSSAPLSVTSR